MDKTRPADGRLHPRLAPPAWGLLFAGILFLGATTISFLGPLLFDLLHLTGAFVIHVPNHAVPPQTWVQTGFDVMHAARYGNGFIGMLGGSLLIMAWDKGFRQNLAQWVRFGGLVGVGCPVLWWVVDMTLYYSVYAQSTGLPLWTQGLLANTLVVLVSVLIGLWVLLTTFHPEVAADLKSSKMESAAG